MPRDLVSTIRGLRKDSNPSVHDLEQAVVELASIVEALSDEVADLRREVHRKK